MYAILCNRHNLAWLYIPDKFRAHRRDRATLRSEEIRISLLSDTQRLQAKWIPGSDHFAGRTYHQRISAFNLAHSSFDSLFSHRYVQALSCDVIGDHFRVNSRLKDRPRIFQFSAQLDGIGQIAVVCDCQRSFYIIDNQRHSIFNFGAPGSGITDMSHPEVAF